MSPDLNTNGAPSGDQNPDLVMTNFITRDDFQTAAALNAVSKSLKKFTTNKALIKAVNNLFLETYESYTGKTHITGSGDAKHLVIHFYTAEACDLCLTSKNLETLPPAVSFLDPMQKYNKPALFMTMLTQLLILLTSGLFTASSPVSESLHDINLTPLIHELGAKAVNVPLSLNFYKPKRWAYITFNSRYLDTEDDISELLNQKDVTTELIDHFLVKLATKVSSLPQCKQTYDELPIALRNIQTIGLPDLLSSNNYSSFSASWFL
ncbi:hypothetical protein RhiirA5_405941 [Rhizophagus irregularis]|uniref:Uncharacterized protein n=1 Tax=Rhizophagus irregularis TaxID=588596 RepID=A0A2I1FC27_9GLOM|nr:hypothetical protein RhiirA5_405941 [Rhizophagus irregularis]PKC74400.1 hypothetical protein RhiirA1_450077 [Rhizophagus irregularis]PKY31867.1 hypothetical protein RhiirB3_449687 [Rhizophagus irregularis]